MSEINSVCSVFRKLNACPLETLELLKGFNIVGRREQHFVGLVLLCCSLLLSIFYLRLFLYCTEAFHIVVLMQMI